MPKPSPQDAPETRLIALKISRSEIFAILFGGAMKNNLLG